MDVADRLRELERSIAARDDALAVVAHDLRNPLNTILMSAQLIEQLEPTIGHAGRKQLEIIMRAGRTMNHLIQDLLEVSRAEADEPLQIEQEIVDIASVIDEVAEATSSRAFRKGLKLRVERGSGNLSVIGDRYRIRQVLSNLAGNALKFTTTGSVGIRAERADACVLVSVTDTGPGIDAANLPHLFDRYWQAKQSNRGGAGLGLAISKAIVSAHGGRIWAESEVGQGTTFFFTVPLAGLESV